MVKEVGGILLLGEKRIEETVTDGKVCHEQTKEYYWDSKEKEDKNGFLWRGRNSNDGETQKIKPTGWKS